MRFALGILAVLVLVSPLLAAGRPMTIDDLLAVRGVGDPRISPDGSAVVCVVSDLDRATDKTNSNLWLIPTSGGEPKQLTTTPGTNNHPRWSPDGKTVAFVSSRGGASQIWLLPIDGGEARQLTKLPIDVAGPVWSPQGDKIAFAVEVVPGKTPEETAAFNKQKEEAKSKVRIYDGLMIRHWNSWDEGKRSHLFVVDLKTGEAKDLTPNLKVNTPPAPFGSSSDYAWSADGKTLAFTAEPMKDSAWSTNTDIWSVPVEGGEPTNLTADNPAADAQPAYSPDGKSLAYLSQARAGFESDLWVLKARTLDGGKTVDVSSHLDRPVQSFCWKDSSSFLATIDDQGAVPVVSLGLSEPAVTRIATGGTNSSVSASADGKKVAFLHNASNRPSEVYLKEGRAEPKPISSFNTPLVKDLDLPRAEDFSFEGAGGDKVHGWLIKPPGFDPNKKYPIVFMIHGGPQGAWHDDWHGRWNLQMFAAPGYAVVAINPRGSTGYGQSFTDQISKDWTGKVYEDLMKGLDHALAAYPFLDGGRIAAAGGSYGGFMVNWIAGHSDRFKALISHAGVFDLTSMYGATEELWFPEWEYGGTPWKNPKHYLENSPSAFVANFKTPTLVIHGALDFRVPDAQGLGMFTSLQRQGVPSRYVWFPDEGHWIVKAPNRIVWWREIQGWLKTYLNPK